VPSQPLRLTSPQLILCLEQLLERSATLEALDEGLAGGRERVQSRAGWATRVGRGRELTIILSSLMAIVTEVVRRCWAVPTG
jgi:hypothetical protein